MSGTPINRPLTDDERSLLLRLAVDVVAGQLGRQKIPVEVTPTKNHPSKRWSRLRTAR